MSEKGILRVEAPKAGAYEIYSIAGDATLQYISERIGYFNKDLPLSPGSYLVLSDCSHATVVIHPGETTSIMAHRVEFVPPLQPSKRDMFSVHCSRYEKTHLRQKFFNRYSFNLLSGTSNLLVSMLPLKIDFSEQEEAKTKPILLKYYLSGIKVSKPPSKKMTPLYFISSVGGPVSITQPQYFGNWQFLLPGRYQVSVNGTNNVLDLGNSEAKEITPAFLKISAPPDINLSLYSAVLGNPFYVEINEEHQLEVDEIYPVLPGTAKLRLYGSTKPTMVALEPNKTTEIKLRSVLVDLNCSPWEWECLGKREVMLYDAGQHYPFLKSHSDLPILYTGDKIEVEMEGSLGLRYRLPDDETSSVLKTGRVVLHPKPTFRPGLVTDLVRLQAIKEPFFGFSHDVKSEHPTVFTLVAGSYFLTRYNSQTTTEYDRALNQQRITVPVNRKIVVDFPFYVPEALAHAHKKSQLALKEQRRSHGKKSSAYRLF